MVCYWNGKESSDYADRRNPDRYIIFPDDINAENGELGFCETIFQAVEIALDILDTLELASLGFSVAQKVKEFIKLLRLTLQEYRNNPNKYRKVLKDLIIQLKELIREIQLERRKSKGSNVDVDELIDKLETVIEYLEKLTGLGCTLLNFAFLHPIDNQKYSTLCQIIDGRNGIENWLVNNITSPFGLIKWKPTDLNYDRIILSRKRILTRIFDEVCTCIEFGNPPPFTPTSKPTPTPTNTCIPCRVTQVPVYNLKCKEIIEGTITPTIYELNQNGEEIPVPVIDMVDCTENPNVLDLLTCTLTTCPPTSSISNTPKSTNPCPPYPCEGCGVPAPEYWDFFDTYPPNYYRISGYTLGGNSYDHSTTKKEIALKIYQEKCNETDEWLTSWRADPTTVSLDIVELPLPEDYSYSQCHRPGVIGFGECGKYFCCQLTVTRKHTGRNWKIIHKYINFHGALVTYETDVRHIICTETHVNKPYVPPTCPPTSTPIPTPIPTPTPTRIPTPTPTPIPTPTPTPTPTLSTTTTTNSSSPTVTPTSTDLGCNYDYSWNKTTRELCITNNNSNSPLLITVTGDNIYEMFEVEPGKTKCNTYSVSIRLTIHNDTIECLNVELL